ncbi:uncharacterized protein LOC135488339 isoform X1 [Lineus longissimus]|uniref:uncharacterized protein LOC135488339 isoform X1 n=1 Tax=Lineus longissimus TaxID=88925 RepID=UPI002B4C665B
MTTKREMQQTGQFHQAMMMNEEAMLMNQALSAAANSEPEVIEEDDTRCILKELFADVQDKGFVLSKSWGELLCSLSKFQGKLMVTENSYVERERLIKQQEEKLKQQTQSWPEEVLQLKSALSRKEKTLVACQAELVHVNKMAELVDVEHNSTKDILEKVLREKSEVEDKCAQYEIDLNTMSQKLQASQEELEIKDQLVAKLEQQMVKEIAESMQEITSLKGLLESREELLEEEKKAHDETNIKLRQLQISYQAMRRTLNSSPQYVPQMPMMPYHDNTHMVSPQPRDEVAYYPTPGSSYTQLWRPVSMRSGGSYSGGPPAKVRRVVTSSSTTEMFHVDDSTPQFPLHHGLFDFDSSANIVEQPSSPRPVPRPEGRHYSIPEKSVPRQTERRVSVISENNRSENQDSEGFESDVPEINDFCQRKSTDGYYATSSILQDARSRVAAFKEQLKQKRNEAFGMNGGAVGSHILGSGNNSTGTLLSRPHPRKQPPVHGDDFTVDVDQPRATRGSKPSASTSKTLDRSPPIATSSSNQVVPDTGTKSPVKSCSVVLSRVKIEKLSPKKSDTPSPQRTSQRSTIIGSLGKKVVGSSPSSGEVRGATMVVNKVWKATKCAVCRKPLPSMAMYIIHAKKEHPGVDVFKCLECNKVFPDPYALRQHSKNKQCPSI